MKSALYTGWVRHRRNAPVSNEFTYKHSMLYLDLAELPALLAREPLVSYGRPNLAWFRRADYLGDPSMPLDESVRELVHERTGTRPDGPIRMLTQLRTLGYLFNPVTFYYVFDRAGRRVAWTVAEITNTPWKERHAYVLAAADAERRGRRQRFRFPKAFHVSPFLPMDIEHDWRFAAPGERLHIHMEDVRDGQVVLDATLALRRRALARHTLTRTVLGHPLATLRVTAAIYWQALRLWWKRCPFFPHPRRAARREEGVHHAVDHDSRARRRNAPGAPAPRAQAGAVAPARPERWRALHP